MALNIKDLREEETRLADIMEHTRRELDAIRCLIAGRELRSEPEAVTHGMIDHLSVEKAVRLIHSESPDKWITSSQMTAMIRQRDPHKDTKSLRVNVGGAQKNLHENKGVLHRKNVGGDVQATYTYMWKQETALDELMKSVR